MSRNLVQKFTFKIYNFCWGLVIPTLGRHHRLSDGFEQRALKVSPPGAVDLWIQAASVGESYLAVELIQKLKTQQSIDILVTSNTSQGIEILENAVREFDSKSDRHRVYVAYFPFDKPDIMQAMVAAVRPGVVVLLETEIWPGLLRALKNFGSSVLIINGRITEKSLRRYRLWPSLWRHLKPQAVLAISQDDAARFGRLFGHEFVDTMSNIKFDRLQWPVSTRDTVNPLIDFLPSDSPFVVLGSIRQEEESDIEKIIQHIQDRIPDAVIGLYPRHMHRVSAWMDRLNHLQNNRFLRSATRETVKPGSVIIWDTFGELQHGYSLAKAAFVGGSLAPLGGQNFLEALTCGVIPIIGPSWKNFAWIGQGVVEQGLVRIAADGAEVAELLVGDITADRPRTEVIEKATKYIEDLKGGTQQACRLINDHLGRQRPPADRLT